jgi:hypothetical protein
MASLSAIIKGVFHVLSFDFRSAQRSISVFFTRRISARPDGASADLLDTSTGSNGDVQVADKLPFATKELASE